MREESHQLEEEIKMAVQVIIMYKDLTFVPQVSCNILKKIIGEHETVNCTGTLRMEWTQLQRGSLVKNTICKHLIILLFDQEVMRTQHDLGIDVITDGEMDRGAYYIHIMNNIKVCLQLATVEYRILHLIIVQEGMSQIIGSIHCHRY